MEPSSLDSPRVPIHQESIVIPTPGRGTTEIGSALRAAVERSGVERGVCVAFLEHTSASLIVCEKADPAVRRDLEAWLARAVPDGDPLFEHVAEGPDDMPAHVRAALTQTSISLPVVDGRCRLGTWQGVYLYEHRRAPHRRSLFVTVLGERGSRSSG